MNIDFGEFLKQKRQEKNLTQKQLAKILFVSESTISKWEKGVARPDITLLPILCETLDVTEHELITASMDNKAREERILAKKWRTLSKFWNLFFIFAYALALLPCFICNLAINKTLSWFWIVFFSIVLSFTFTNLPKHVKKYKVIFIPLSSYIALCLLLGVVCLYTKGNWFFIPVLSVLFALVSIFLPIYISKYKIFEKIKRHNAYITLSICFIILNFLLIVINSYILKNGFSEKWWYFKIALPIALVVYVFLNILVSVKFLKLNKSLKTSIVLLLINLFVYLPPAFLKFKNLDVQKVLNDLNIFKADFSKWEPNTTLNNNVHLLIFITILVLSVCFLVVGLARCNKSKKK